jgi:prolyl oligopeptidase
MSRRFKNNAQSYWFVYNRLCQILLIVIVGSAIVSALTQAPKTPPKTRTDNVKEMLHGVEIVDPYRWLEDQDSPETRAWIQAQNERTQSILGSLPGREQLKQRLAQLLKIDAIGVPAARNGRYFFSKRRADQDLFVIYMREGLKGPDQALIDPHSMSPDHTTSVNLLEVSEDGTLIAYGVRQGGQDEVAVNWLDVNTRKELPDRLPKGRFSGIALKPDKSGFYYSRYGGDGPRVYYHAMGTDPASDAEIFGKGYGPGIIIGIALSEDGRYLLIEVSHGSAAEKSEIYYQDVTNPGPIVPVVNDINARFTGRIVGDQLFLDTNWEAPTERILVVDLKNPARDHWREVIPTSQATIQSFSLVGGNLFVNYLENVVSRVKVFEPDGKHLRDITFPAIGSVGSISGRWNSNEAFFTFSSFHIPTTIYRYDVASGSQDVWARLEVPINSDNFEVKQVWYESKDKTKVPMFIVHAKGLKLNGSNPTLLTGYGGFTVSLTPSFSSLAALWVERGGVYAVPNLRGGGEFGEEWHKAGMLEKKQNVFDDFIAAAEWLSKNGYTNSSKLAIAGGSNGGLLVGAALTQRPDLVQAVVCSYPLLDMVRYHKFLVAKFWVPEYGSSEDPNQFKYIYAYSPYHHVKPGAKYPAVLLISGDSDTRVAPLHARKMAALLQAATGSDKPVLLHYDTKAGHSGGLPVSKQIDDLTDELSFLFWQLGVGAEDGKR